MSDGAQRTDSSDDLWLEEVEGEAALAWVRERSAAAESHLHAVPQFAPVRDAVRRALEADDRIPDVREVDGLLYNLWTDAEHPRGLWRRTTWESYRAADPADTAWEVLLDLDELSEREGTAWVWHGAQFLHPDGDRVLITLSPGGSDADTTREFDLPSRSFVDADAGGFVRPQGKGSLSWVDRDTVLVTTDLGPGTTTTSGYARTLRRWARGEPLAQAPVLHEIPEDEMLLAAYHDDTPGFERDVLVRIRSFFERTLELLRPDDTVVTVPAPPSADVEIHRQWVSVRLRHDWEVGGTTHPAGSLLVVGLEDLMGGDPTPTPLFTPDERSALVDAVWTRSHLVLTVLRDVRHELEVHSPTGEDPASAWARTPLTLTLPDGSSPSPLATVAVSAVDERDGDDLWVRTTDWLTPMRLLLTRLGADPAGARTELLRSTPERYQVDGLTQEQHWATSTDGTRVPYVQVGPADLPLDGSTPTVLFGYGGFEVPLTPAYDPVVGHAWLEHGSVYVVAGIRGGGEFGPGWHQGALRENRNRAHEDFVAVARDLVERGVTVPRRLGVSGRSNGGLLVGNILTGYPEDVGAVVCQVPLLDMQRYTHLLAGASWASEYGDPDTADWEFLRAFSPYHRFDPQRPTPPVYLATSTRDDRVHPGHARRMAHLLQRHDRDVTYWENTEGGHGGASTPEQWAHWHALAWAFFHQRLTGA